MDWMGWQRVVGHHGGDTRILAYVSGNVNYAGYLNIVYPGTVRCWCLQVHL